MHVTTTKLPKSQVQLDIEIAPDEFRPFLTKAAESLSREHPLKGFRPGKVPYAMAVQRYGAMAVHEEAMEPAVRDTFVRAVAEQKIETVGPPKISVTQLAPENPVKYTATVAVLPTVELPDVAGITVTKRPVQVTTADVDKALADLQKMAPQEALTDRAATAEDKVVVNMTLTRNGVVVEGGSTTDHSIYLAEEYNLPKVRTELVGMKKNDTKQFDLEFPKDHFQKNLAGHTVQCSVTVTDVFAVTYPTPDDMFAKRLGLDSILALRGRIRENLEAEARQRTEQQEDAEILNALATNITTDDLPEHLITTEAHRMVDELERSITSRGLQFEDYLQHLKKTRDDLLLGMAPEAVRRVKIALATRAVSVAQPDTCTVTDAEIDAEVQRELTRYKDEPAYHDRLQSPEARDYIRGTLRNKKVMTWLRGQVKWK